MDKTGIVAKEPLVDDPIPPPPTLHVTDVEDLGVFHSVPQLGPGVAEAIARLARTYAQRASLRELPPITLCGEGWDLPWETLATRQPCAGNAGPSYTIKPGDPGWYTCLVLSLPTPFSRPREHLPPMTLEGIIAHEIVHLRWPRLQHGLEFDARVLAILRGTTFPPHAGWRGEIKRTMEETREELRRWWAERFPNALVGGQPSRMLNGGVS